MSAVFQSHPLHVPRRRTLELDSTLEAAFSVPLLAKARHALTTDDLAAFSATCHRWLREARGIMLGDGVLLLGRSQPLELRVEDFALSWNDGDTTAEPWLCFYGLTLHADAQQATRQWNRLRHDASLAKVARHSDALTHHLARMPSVAGMALDEARALAA